MNELDRMRGIIEDYLENDRPIGHHDSMLTYLLSAVEACNDDLTFLCAVAVKPGTIFSDEPQPVFTRRNIDSDNVRECLEMLELRLSQDGRMCVMTNDYVYFPQEYDSSVWVSAVPRNTADIVPLTNSGI